MLDRFAGRLKLVTTLLMAAGTLSMCLFSANAAGYLPTDHSSAVTVAYVSGIAGGSALNVAIPLLFELIMETVYGWADEAGVAVLEPTAPQSAAPRSIAISQGTRGPSQMDGAQRANRI